MIRLENILKTSLQDFLKMSSKRLEDVFKMSWRRLEDVLKTFLQDVLKTSWRRLEDVWLRPTYWSWPRRLEDVFWRRKTKANIFVLINTSWRRLWRQRRKTSSRRLRQDECFLGYVLMLRYSFSQKLSSLSSPLDFYLRDFFMKILLL